MNEIFGKRFFEALQTIADHKLGNDHPCARAVADAARTGAKTDIEVAQEHLSALPAELSAELMEAVHKAMREDPSALLDLWQPAGGNDRFH